MANYNHLIFFLFFLIITTMITNSFASTKCSDKGPEIQFPFYTKDQIISSLVFRSKLPEPIFELRCSKTGSTTIRFESYPSDLSVKSISYEARNLNLVDPKSCVHEVFLNLDLSLTPFRYYYDVKSYTYINCSSSLAELGGLSEIPCLSGNGSHVYSVDPSMEVPSSCETIKTVAIPFGYSSYLDDHSFGLRFSWDSFGAKTNGGFTISVLQGLSVVIVILAVAIDILMTITLYGSHKSVHPDGSISHTQVKADRYVGDYISCPAKECDVDQVNDRC